MIPVVERTLPGMWRLKVINDDMAARVEAAGVARQAGIDAQRQINVAPKPTTVYELGAKGSEPSQSTGAVGIKVDLAA